MRGMNRTAALALALALICLALPAAASGAALDRLLAPPRACPGQARLGTPAATQERTMRCMTNFARRRTGRRPLAHAGALARSAGRKTGDMLRCGFGHQACGRSFDHWIRRTGYLRGGCGGLAENIAWGVGRLATVRAIFRAWLYSPGHRRNVLGRFEDLGVGLRVGALNGRQDAHVWVQHFGSRC